MENDVRFQDLSFTAYTPPPPGGNVKQQLHRYVLAMDAIPGEKKGKKPAAPIQEAALPGTWSSV